MIGRILQRNEGLIEQTERPTRDSGGRRKCSPSAKAWSRQFEDSLHAIVDEYHLVRGRLFHKFYEKHINGSAL